jgi:hypothetical protein
MDDERPRRTMATSSGVAGGNTGVARTRTNTMVVDAAAGDDETG